MLLRQFYVQQNEKGILVCATVFGLAMKLRYRLAPKPKQKGNRDLKTEIPPWEADKTKLEIDETAKE